MWRSTTRHAGAGHVNGLGGFALALGLTMPAAAPCQPGWDVTAGQAGLSTFPDAMVVFDDGNGPAVYVGGIFTQTGGLTVNRIARWDGSS
jgi:hypothetical protein